MLAESRSSWYTWPRVLGMLGVPGAGLGGEGAAARVQQAARRPCTGAGQSLQPQKRGSKGQQRAACCAGRVAQMGTGFGPAAAAGEEPSSPQAPSRPQPPRLSSPCFVNRRFCWSRRVGAACKHPFLLQQEGGSSSGPSPGVFPSPLPCASHRGARRAPAFGAVQLPGGVPCAGTGRTPLRGLLPKLSPLR